MLTSNEKSQNNKRIIYFDALRAIACLSVVLVHTSSRYVMGISGLSFNFWIGNFFDSIGRIAIPLFVMLSGALFLDEKYNYSDKKIINHIIKILEFYIFWSILYALIYFVISPFLKHKVIDVKKVIYQIFFGYYHLWFCFMIIGLYLIVPILRLWVKKENRKTIEYFIILSLLYTCIIPSLFSFFASFNPFFNNFKSFFDLFHLNYISGYTVYFILGWYLHNFDFKYKKALYISGFVGVLVSYFGTFLLVKYAIKYEDGFYDNLAFHIFVQACAVYIFARNALIFRSFEDNNKLHMLTKFISKYSLGIYAMHAVVYEALFAIIEHFTPFNYAIINIPVVFIITAIFCVVACAIMDKIPFFNKFIK